MNIKKEILLLLLFSINTCNNKERKDKTRQDKTRQDNAVYSLYDRIRPYTTVYDRIRAYTTEYERIRAYKHKINQKSALFMRKIA